MEFQSTPPRGWRQIINRIRECDGGEFQSTPPRGWRLMSWMSDRDSLGISIHSTARVETKVTASSFYLPHYFNPLHREGGDVKLNPKPSDWEPISIHSTARVETGKASYIRRGKQISIHSTARVETTGKAYCKRYQFISIHSTARVETYFLVEASGSLDISIHSTARVETGARVSYTDPATKFQSTPPRGWRR